MSVYDRLAQLEQAISTMESRAGQAMEFWTGDSLENMLTPEQLPRNQYRPSLSPPAGEAEVAIDLYILRSSSTVVKKKPVAAEHLLRTLSRSVKASVRVSKLWVS